MESEHIPDSLYRSYLKIAGVVLAYWVISISTVFINKELLSSGNEFNAPLFVTWFQCLFTSLVCMMLSHCRDTLKTKTFLDFPHLKLSKSQCMKVLPLSVVFVAMISFNNLCLKYVDVAFYYLARCLTVVTNVAFTYLILSKTVSPKSILCCCMITFGYMLGIDQEFTTSSLMSQGVIYGFLASCCVSLNSIYTKKVLPLVDDSIWALTLCNNLNATILFIPVILISGEFPTKIFVSDLYSLQFWSFMVVGGICGISIGSVTALQIKVTSALTHNISGTAKACVQTVIACWIHNDKKSLLWWFSNFVVLLSSAGYSFFQQKEMAKAHRSSSIK